MGLLKLIIAGLSLVNAQNLRGSSLSFLEKSGKCCNGINKCGECCPNCVGGCCQGCTKRGCCGCKCCGCCTQQGPYVKISAEGMQIDSPDTIDADRVPSCYQNFDGEAESNVENADVKIGQLCTGMKGTVWQDSLFVKGNPEEARKAGVYGFASVPYTDIDGNEVDLPHAYFAVGQTKNDSEADHLEVAKNFVWGGWFGLDGKTNWVSPKQYNEFNNLFVFFGRENTAYMYPEESTEDNIRKVFGDQAVA